MRRLERIKTRNGTLHDSFPEDFHMYGDGTEVLPWPEISADITYGADPVGGTVALLGNGPSLATEWKGGDYSAVIACNRCAKSHGCDWWCFCDPWVLDAWEWAKPRVGIAGAMRYLYGHDSAKLPAGSVCVYDTTDGMRGTPVEWRNTTMPTALWFACHALKAECVHMYGVDWSGNKYFTGETMKHVHNEDRWIIERRACEQISAHFGVPVVRHTADGPVRLPVDC